MVSSTPLPTQQICRYFQRGGCTFGAACVNLHQPASRSTCIFFTMGRCAKGDACSFAHPSPSEEGQKSVEPGDSGELNGTAPSRPVCRYWVNGTCTKGGECRFAHEHPAENCDGEVTPSSHSGDTSAECTTPDTLPSILSSPGHKELPSCSPSGDSNRTEPATEENHRDDQEVSFSEEVNSAAGTNDVSSNTHPMSPANVDGSFSNSSIPIPCEGEPHTLICEGPALAQHEFQEPEGGGVESPHYLKQPLDDDCDITVGDTSLDQEHVDPPTFEATAGDSWSTCYPGEPDPSDSPCPLEESSSNRDTIDSQSEGFRAADVNEDSDTRYTDTHVIFPDGHPHHSHDDQGYPSEDQEHLAEGLAVPHWTDYADPYADLMIPFCKFFAQARCTQGDACRFRHSLSINEYGLLFRDPQPLLWTSNAPLRRGEDEQRAKISSFNVCKFYPLGKCRNGAACPYLHTPSTELLPVVPELPMNHENNEQEYPSGSQDEYETQLCRYYMESGTCRRGDQCYYSHENTFYRQSAGIASGAGRTDDQWRDNHNPVVRAGYTQRRSCKWFQEGHCQWGDKCKYLHDSQSTEANGQIEVNPSANNTTSTSEDNGWGENAGGWGSYIDEWAPKVQENNDSPPADNEQPGSHGWPPEEEDDPWAPKPVPCPYHARGRCKKGNHCNFSHDNPQVTTQGGAPGSSTTRNAIQSTTLPPEHSDPWEDHSHEDTVDDGWGTRAPDEMPWGGTGETETRPVPAADGWPDDESENEYTPWAVPKDPICDFYAKGHCKKGKWCRLRHEDPSEGASNPTEQKSSFIATDGYPVVDHQTFTVNSTATTEAEGPGVEGEDTAAEEDAAVDEGPTAEEEDPAVDEENRAAQDALTVEQSAAAEEEGPVTEEADSSPAVEKEETAGARTQIPTDEGQGEMSFPQSPNEDEKTWSMEWSHDAVEPLVPAKIQAPCKAFGQGYCPSGDSCRYQHIVEVDAVMEDRRQSPTTAESPDSGVLSEETEKLAVNEMPIDELSVPDVEPEVVVERELFNCTVRFGLDNGCSPTNIATASDSCRAIVSNLPSDISYPEAVELAGTIDDLGQGVEDLACDFSDVGADLTMRFTTVQDTVKAVVKLHGQTYDSRPLTARLATESIMSTLECKTVKITWSSPSRSVWAYYPTITTAKAHEKRLDGLVFQGRKIKAMFSRPRPNDTTYAVKLSGFLVDAEKTAIEQLSQASLVHLNAPTYVGCPLDSIRDTLAARGSLEHFYRLPLDPLRSKHMAFARFDAGMSNMMAAHGVPQPFLEDRSLSLQKVFHANYKISTRRHQAVRKVLEQLSSTCQEHCTLRIYDEAEPVDIHIYADTEERTAFGVTNRKLQAALLGEVMVTSDGVPIWDEYFDISSSARAVEKINVDTTFFVKVDHRTQRIRAIGDEDSRARAHGIILKLLKMVRAQRHVVRLDLPALRMLVDGGYTALQTELGANKVTLNVTVPELIVRGDADVRKARTALAAAASSTSSDGVSDDAVASGDSESGASSLCVVCLRPPLRPTKLSCRHVYCETCLQYVLQVSAGLQFVPPRCIAQGVSDGDESVCDGTGGRCGEYIPYVVARELLRTVDEAALLRNAFLAYVRARPDEFFFCPTPHCETVYRPKAEERSGAPVYTCPTCNIQVCSVCCLEYHEGLDCMCQDSSVVIG